MTRTRPGLLACLALALAVTGTTQATARADAGASTGPSEVASYYSTPPGGGVAAVTTYAQLMSIPSTDTEFAPQVAAPLGDAARACPPARCRDARVPLPAGVKVSDNRVRVLLPPNYATSRRRYPVVYLFTAGANGYDGYTRRSTITAMTSRMQAIFVMPDAGTGTNLGMFSDWRDGTWQWETYHTRVLPAWVQRTFRTIPGRQAAIGNSVSGGGVLSYAARHPGLYRAVMSTSGLTDTHLLLGNALPRDYRPLGGSFPDLSRVWGDPVLDASTWAAHNPVDLAARLRGTTLFLSSGTGYDTPGTDQPGSSGRLEATLWQGERTFLAALTRDGVAYHARVAEGDAHGWAWFERPLRWGLTGIMAELRRPSSTS